MGWCTDQATTYLKRLGYNVVRHPQEGIEPLDLIGQQTGTINYLGGVARLITSPPGPLPNTDRDLVAADINGQSSSKLKLSVGATILGPIIGAMGGNLGVETKYTNAKTMEFHFADVLKDRVAPLDVGNYLRDGSVDAANEVLKQYVLGNGNLFLITETIKTKSLKVKYERDAGVAASIDVPTIENIVGGKVAIDDSAAQRGEVSYSGKRYLTFGFRCFQVGVKDGDLTVFASKPGVTPLAASDVSSEEETARNAALLTDERTGLLDLEQP